MSRRFCSLCVSESISFFIYKRFIFVYIVPILYSVILFIYSVLCLFFAFCFLCPSKATNVFSARVIKAWGKDHAWYSGFPKEGVGLERRNVDVAENVSQNLKAYKQTDHNIVDIMSNLVPNIFQPPSTKISQKLFFLLY